MRKREREERERGEREREWKREWSTTKILFLVRKERKNQDFPPTQVWRQLQEIKYVVSYIKEEIKNWIYNIYNINNILLHIIQKYRNRLGTLSISIL